MITKPVEGIVLIVCDQLNRNLVSFAGAGGPHTPNIDRLAARSVRFDRAYVTNPTCMPNRAAMATGRWPSANGTRTNGIPLHPDNPTVAELLRRSAWSTSAAGKLHFQNMGWPLENHQLAQIKNLNPPELDPGRPEADHLPDPATWDGHEDMAIHRDRPWLVPSPYYGYDHVDLVVGHGDKPSGPYQQWAADRGVDLERLGGYENGTNRLKSWDEVWRSEVPTEVHHTTYTVEGAIAAIDRLAVGDRPFHVYCSFPDPHHPFCPPADYFDRYDPRDVTLPPTFRADHHRLVPHLQSLLREVGVPGDPTELWAPTETQMRAVLAAQYGQIALIDDAVGRLVDKIDATEANIAVIFTTDHGDMMGEHGLLLKHWAHYEGTTRIPLLVSAPGLGPEVRSDLVSSADVAATMYDLAGVTAPVGVQGRSLLGSGPGREAVMIEEEHLFGFRQLQAPIRIRTIVTDQYRFTRYFGTDYGELYDLTTDPDETVNRYNEAGHQAAQRDLQYLMTEELVALTGRGRSPTAAA